MLIHLWAWLSGFVFMCLWPPFGCCLCLPDQSVWVCIWYPSHCSRCFWLSVWAGVPFSVSKFWSLSLSVAPNFCVSNSVASPPPCLWISESLSLSISLFPSFRISCLIPQTPPETGSSCSPTPTALASSFQSCFPLAEPWLPTTTETWGPPLVHCLTRYSLFCLCHHSGMRPKAWGSWPHHLALLLAYASMGI